MSFPFISTKVKGKVSVMNSVVSRFRNSGLEDTEDSPPKYEIDLRVPTNQSGVSSDE
jgi:hypothetical protein